MLWQYQQRGIDAVTQKYAETAYLNLQEILRRSINLLEALLSRFRYGLHLRYAPRHNQLPSTGVIPLGVFTAPRHALQ